MHKLNSAERREMIMATDDDAQHDYTSTFDDESGLLFNQNGRCGFFYEINPLVRSSFELREKLTLFFNDELPEGGRLQLLTLGSQDVKTNYLDMNYLDMTEESAQGIGFWLDTIAGIYTTYLEEGGDFVNAPDGVHDRYFRVFVIYGGDKKAMKNMIKFQGKLEHKLEAEHFFPVLCKADDLLQIDREMMQLDLAICERVVSMPGEEKRVATKLVTKKFYPPELREMNELISSPRMAAFLGENVIEDGDASEAKYHQALFEERVEYWPLEPDTIISNHKLLRWKNF